MSETSKLRFGNVAAPKCSDAKAIISAEASTPTTLPSGMRAAITAVTLAVAAAEIQDALRILQIEQRQHLGRHRLLQRRDPRVLRRVPLRHWSLPSAVPEVQDSPLRPRLDIGNNR